MTKARLTDTQCIILAEAAKRDDGSFLPLTNIDLSADKLADAVGPLEKRGFAEVFDVTDETKRWRICNDVMTGLRNTAKGLAAIGIEDAPTPNPSKDIVLDAHPDEEGEASQADTQVEVLPVYPTKPSKQMIVIDLLSRAEGASIDELITATGWLPHTTRAMLTGLKKKGHTLASTKAEGVRRYSIVAGHA